MPDILLHVVTIHKLCFCFLSLSQGIMLVYDITNEKSFDNIRNWIRNIEEVRNRADAGENKHEVFISFCESVVWIHFCLFYQHASSDVERMVLGNKCDMNDKRQVSKEKGEKVCIVKK